jgi:hypothetical protein
VASSHVAGLLLAASLSAIAATPSLKHFFPAAGAQGTTVTVTANGKFDPWPVKAWADGSGIDFKPTDKAGKFDVEIAKDAAPGPHLVRFYNDSGASQPRFFIVSTEPELADTEPNDEFKSPQKIVALPATISGKLDKSGDVDCFAVALKKSETLTASLEAYVLMSTFDGLLRIVDERGTQLAFNHDGRTLDPLLAWQAPRDGTFVVQLMGFAYPGRAEVAFTGGEGCIYRLHLAAGAAAEKSDDTKRDAPSLSATVASDSFVVKADKPVEIKVAVKRAKDFKTKLKLAAKYLPEGVTAAEVDVPDKDGEVTLKLTAAPDCNPASQPIQLVLREVEGGAEHLVEFSLIKTSEDNGVPQGYTELVINSTSQLWLTVIGAPPKPEPPKPEPAK